MIDLADSILATNLDPRAAHTYQTKFEDAGCSFRLGAKVCSVQGDASGTINALTLESGERLPCDLLIVAAGVKPALGFLANSGIETARAITVDAHMATSVTNVYAAVDITGLSESWPSAVTQGEIAAMNMCGVPTAHPGLFLPKNTVHFFGVPSLSIGRFTAEDGETEHIREDRNRYQKTVLHDGVPVGVILQGDISRSGFWQQLIQEKVNIAEMHPSIWNVSFADAYHVDEKGEYQWLI